MIISLTLLCIWKAHRHQLSPQLLIKHKLPYLYIVVVLLSISSVDLQQYQCSCVEISSASELSCTRIGSNGEEVPFCRDTELQSRTSHVSQHPSPSTKQCQKNTLPLESCTQIYQIKCCRNCPCREVLRQTNIQEHTTCSLQKGSSHTLRHSILLRSMPNCPATNDTLIFKKSSNLNRQNSKPLSILS